MQPAYINRPTDDGIWAAKNDDVDDNDKFLRPTWGGRHPFCAVRCHRCCYRQLSLLVSTSTIIIIRPRRDCYQTLPHVPWQDPRRPPDSRVAKTGKRNRVSL